MAEPGPVDLVAEFGDADEVVLSDNLDRRRGATRDAARIGAVMAVLAELTDGWHVPEGGVPVARTRLNFRREDTAIGNLGVDSRFLSAHVNGGFLARHSDAATAGRLLDAAAINRLPTRPAPEAGPDLDPS